LVWLVAWFIESIVLSFFVAGGDSGNEPWDPFLIPFVFVVGLLLCWPGLVLGIFTLWWVFEKRPPRMNIVLALVSTVYLSGLLSFLLVGFHDVTVGEVLAYPRTEPTFLPMVGVAIVGAFVAAWPALRNQRKAV
jgi:hypothetical protein